MNKSLFLIITLMQLNIAFAQENKVISLRCSFSDGMVTNFDNADEPLRQSWDKVYAVMQKHELVHRQHAVDAANEIDLAIMSIPSARDCNLLSFNSKTIAESIIVKYHKLDEELDRTEPLVIADDKLGFI